MTPKCPDCKSNEEVEYTGDDKLTESGELYYDKVYKCYKCGIEFTEDEDYLWGLQKGEI